MKNLFKSIVLLLLISFSNILAAPVGNKTPTSYIIKINELAMYNSTTSTWIVFGENQSFDIAKVGVGEAVGNMAGSIGQIPDGTYTKLRVKIDNTFIWDAPVGSNPGLSFDFSAAPFSYPPYAESGFGFPMSDGSNGFILQYSLSNIIFPIPEGNQTSFRIDFDVEGIVEGATNPGIPDVTIEIDGEDISNNNMYN